MFKKRCILVLIIAMIISTIPTMAFADGDDNLAPVLKAISLDKTTLKAGDTLQVKIQVDENQTGLKRARIQLSSNTLQQKAISEEKVWSTPVFSSGDTYISFSIPIKTSTNMLSADWFIAYLEFEDAKGNYCYYYGSPDNNMMVSANLGGVQGSVAGTGSLYVKVYGTVGDVTEPVLNWIKAVNTTVEKPGILKLQLNITETSGIYQIAFDFSNEDYSDTFSKVFYDMGRKTGPYTYTLNVPINNDRHNGKWYVNNLQITDLNGNHAFYTTELGNGYFINYYDHNEKFNIVSFRVTGVNGDETKPAVEKIEVLNGAKTVYKPGVLKFKLNLKEEDSGITNIEVGIKCTSTESIDIKSQQFYWYSAKGYLCDDYIGTSGLYFEKPLMSGEYEFSMPVPAVCMDGTYILYVRELKDRAGNTYRNYIGEDQTETFAVEDEFSYDFEMGIGNGDLISAIKNMDEGKTGRILLSNTKSENVLPKAALDAIAGLDKTLVCYKDGYQWIFRGKNISADLTKDINLTTKIYMISGEMLSSNEKAVCLAFENNGALPGIVEFRFKSAFVKNYFGNKDDLYLYHVDEGKETAATEAIDFSGADYDEIDRRKSDIEVIVDDKDAWCYVDISHNSKYLVSGSKLRKLTLKDARVSGCKTSYSYSGKYIKPDVKVKLAAKNLKAKRDYTVSYKANKNVGTAKIIIKGKGKYAGSSVIKKFTIKPQKTSINKLRGSRKAVAVNWKKVSRQCSGYQIQYSTDRKFKLAKAVIVKGYTKTSKKIGKLKTNKKYYLRVRTYKKNSSGTYYSSWSKVKTIKTK